MLIAERLPRFRWVALAIAFLGQWSNTLCNSSIAPLAPLFQPELGLTSAQVGFFCSVTFLGAWGLLLVGGSLTDRHGVRTMMSLGQVAAGALMLSMVAAGSFAEAVAVMFVVGIGRGVACPGMAKAVTEWFPASSRGTAMGVNQSAGPLAGMFLASTLPAIGLAAGWRVAIACAGLFIIVDGLITAVVYRDAQVVGPVVVRPSMRAGLSRVLRNRQLWVLSSLSLLYLTAQIALTTYLVLYFKEVVLVPAVPDEHERIIAAGRYLALCQAGGVFGRVSWGFASDRLFRGRRMVVLALIGLLAMAMSVIMACLGPGLPLWLLSVFVFAYGSSIIGWNGLYQAVIVETAGRGDAATGIGLSLTITQTAAVAGPIVFGFVVDLTGTYQASWLLMAALCVAGTLVAAASARGEKRLA